MNSSQDSQSLALSWAPLKRNAPVTHTAIKNSSSFVLNRKRSRKVRLDSLDSCIIFIKTHYLDCGGATVAFTRALLIICFVVYDSMRKIYCILFLVYYVIKNYPLVDFHVTRVYIVDSLEESVYFRKISLHLVNQFIYTK